MAAGTLTALTLELLRDEDALVADFLAELRSVPAYADGAVPEHTLREDATRSFELILRSLAGMPVPDDVAAVSTDVGRARAEAGVPLEALLHAVRLDFRVVWQALHGRVHRTRLGDLVAEGPRIWEAVERHSMGVLAAYQQRVLEMARAEQDERARWFVRLLDCDGRHSDIRRQVATVLELAEDGRFVVAAAAPEQHGRLRHATDQLTARGVRLHIHEQSSSSAVVVQLPARGRASPARWFRDVSCGLSPVVHGLSHVPRAVRLAEATLRVLYPSAKGPVPTRDRWLALAASRLGEFADDLDVDVLGGLDTLSAHDAERVLEAVTAYLRTTSLARTARDLYCHRNTVLNRLHRFTAATGRDVMSSADAAVIALALAARAQRTT